MRQVIDPEFVCRLGRACVPVLVAVLAAVMLAPSPATAATCSAYPNQAAAQRAADTRDADGDGVYCETLPCPCLKPGSGASTPKPKSRRATKGKSSCVRTSRVVPIGFSGTKYPKIRQHWEDAIAAGWPRILVLNRPGAEARRERALRDVPTKHGYDRDEYPPAVGRGRGPRRLRRGIHPVGWITDVAYVPSSENRSHGSTMGIKLRRYCNDQRFRYVFY